MQRVVSLTANIHGEPLGDVASDVESALKRVGEAPRGVKVALRGQIPSLQETLNGLGIGLLLRAVAFMKLAKIIVPTFALALLASSAGAQSVKTAKVVAQTKGAERRLVLRGELLPYQQVALHARVSGYVQSVLVDRGSRVRRGQLLARLSAPELAAQVAEADSRLRTAQAGRAEAEARLASSQAIYRESAARSIRGPAPCPSSWT